MTKKEDALNFVEDAAGPVQANRRSLLVGTGLLAATAGLGAAWWTYRSRHALADEPAPGFWDWQWPRPEGGDLLLKSFQSRPLLINFWATWCTPCIEELPLINDFYKKNSANGFQVVAVAVDKMPLVQAFLQKNPLEFPVAVSGLAGAQSARALGNLSGGLPFSVVLDARAQVVLRKSGRLTQQDLDALTGLK